MSEMLKKQMNKITPLTEDEFAYIFSFYRHMTIPKKEHLLRAGQVCKYLYYCDKGCFRKYDITEEGKEIVVDFAVEDYWVGDPFSLVNQSPTRYNIQALEDSDLYGITYDDYRAICAQMPKMQQGYVMFVGRNNNAIIDMLAHSKTASAEERYLKLLERFPTLPNRVAANHIASYLGIEPASLSRLKKKFASR
jgi:CRP-like cAMP-binding protein